MAPVSGGQQGGVAVKLLMDVPEVAEALGCGRTFVYQLITNGDIPIVKLGRLTRVRVTDVETLISHSAIGPDETDKTGRNAAAADAGRAASRRGAPHTVPQERF
ncbi:MAG TPA: helix-turn-helix domain-containing protein [Candidatus Angelobacter sp.]|nr:helix-turn-helix domain-containing protein [Candidatus Angelobacter sp.]